MLTEHIYYTISEQIADEIRKDIISGNLKEGTSLKEMELSKKYNVSRGPIRDSLKILSKEGFIISKPNVGVRVAPHPNPDVLSLIIDIRKQIETFALNEVFGNFTEDDFVILKKIMEKLYDACKQDDIYLVKSIDMRFHGFIVAKQGDKHLYEMWLAATNRIMFRYTRLSTLMDSYNEHNNIISALENGDKVEATRLLQRNIQ